MTPDANLFSPHILDAILRAVCKVSAVFPMVFLTPIRKIVYIVYYNFFYKKEKCVFHVGRMKFIILSLTKLITVYFKINLKS